MKRHQAPLLEVSIWLKFMTFNAWLRQHQQNGLCQKDKPKFFIYLPVISILIRNIVTIFTTLAPSIHVLSFASYHQTHALVEISRRQHATETNLHVRQSNVMANTTPKIKSFGDFDATKSVMRNFTSKRR